MLAQHWRAGEAAAAYQSYIEVNWSGALFIAKEIATLVGKGFAKLAEWSIKLAEKAVDLLERIIRRVVELAKRFVPGAGQICGVIEWIASGFEDFPYWSEVRNIIGLIEEVLALHKRIEELVGALQGFIDALNDAFEAVRAIPEIGSFQDAAETGRKLVGSGQDIGKRKDEVVEKKRQLEEQASAIDKRLNPG